MLAILVAFCASAMAGQEQPAPVPAADLSKLRLSDFDDAELAVPFYLEHFHKLANSVRLTEPNRGFITLPVWRPRQFNKPYNARVLENHYSMAFFYTTDRPWNPYRAHPALRQRLEAVLDLWCGSQSDHGWFSEYGPKRWNLAATGFGVMFMGQTLALLHDGPPIDPAIHQRTIAAQKKAIRALLTDEGLFNAGRNCSNQYSSLWGGMLAFLKHYPDEELAGLLRKRLTESLEHHQSPAGYWYEAKGCDWPYTLRTHHGNLWMAWHYARGTDLEQFFVKGEERWAEWVAWNTVLEPDGRTCVINRGIETRTSGDYTPRHNPIAEKVDLARVLMPSRSERRDELAQARRKLEQSWPKTSELHLGDHHAYSPHVLLNLHHYRWHPTDAERRAALDMLPCLGRAPLNHQRADDKGKQVFTFVRREAYYAVFSAGKKLTDRQRFGLGMVWARKAGVVLQSQSSSRDSAWGTRPEGAGNVYETQIAAPAFEINGKTCAPAEGVRDLDAGDVEIGYPLGKKGAKTVILTDARITAKVEHDGPFTEQLPLLVPEGTQLEIGKGSARVGNCLAVTFDEGAKAEAAQTDRTVAGKKLVVLRLSSGGSLSYAIVLPD